MRHEYLERIRFAHSRYASITMSLLGISQPKVMTTDHAASTPRFRFQIEARRDYISNKTTITTTTSGNHKGPVSSHLSFVLPGPLIKHR